MKKLRLKALSLGAREILSRDQLKSVTGGCTTHEECTDGRYCNPATSECDYLGSGFFCYAKDVGPCSAPLFPWQRLWQNQIWDSILHTCVDDPYMPPYCN